MSKLTNDRLRAQIDRLPRDDTGRITSDYEPSALEIEVARRAIRREFGDNGTDGYYIRILKAIRAAASTSTEAVGVKELVWEEPNGSLQRHRALATGHLYLADKLEAGGFRLALNLYAMPGHIELGIFPALDAAKAAAQADYEQRILAALEPRASDRERTIEECAKVANEALTTILAQLPKHINLSSEALSALAAIIKLSEVSHEH